MELDLTTINRINENLRKSERPSLCTHVNSNNGCIGIMCAECPLADNLHDYPKIQKQLEMLEVLGVD
jgi:hypothetical protein